MPENRKYKILLVEDEESLRNLYFEYLQMEGFDVLAAEDGQVALDLVDQHVDTIDLILLDLMLPKVDGLKVLERIKTNPKTKQLKVYLMTVLDRDAIIKKAFDAGADGYLIKDTLNPEQVKNEILNALKDSPEKKSFNWFGLAK